MTTEERKDDELEDSYPVICRKIESFVINELDGVCREDWIRIFEELPFFHGEVIEESMAGQLLSTESDGSFFIWMQNPWVLWISIKCSGRVKHESIDRVSLFWVILSFMRDFRRNNTNFTIKPIERKDFWNKQRITVNDFSVELMYLNDCSEWYFKPEEFNHWLSMRGYSKFIVTEGLSSSYLQMSNEEFFLDVILIQRPNLMVSDILVAIKSLDLDVKELELITDKEKEKRFKDVPPDVRAGVCQYIKVAKPKKFWSQLGEALDFSKEMILLLRLWELAGENILDCLIDFFKILKWVSVKCPNLPIGVFIEYVLLEDKVFYIGSSPILLTIHRILKDKYKSPKLIGNKPRSCAIS